MNNLFFSEEELIGQKRGKKKAVETYEEFVAKFNKEMPKTTDDCYTPQPLYEAIVRWLGERVDLSGREIIRPFYPGGDYLNEEYPENCIVIDNPPFSIISKVTRFYTARGIDFFLFAPHLTLFNCAFMGDVCYLVTNTPVEFENGAKINIGFVTSLFKGCRIFIASSLAKVIKDAQKKAKDNNVLLPKYELPKNVVTAARLGKNVGADDIMIPADECYPVRRIDNMRKSLFGGGFLLSQEQAALIARAEQAALIARAEQAVRVEQAAQAALIARAKRYELSARELAIIEELNKNHKR